MNSQSSEAVLPVIHSGGSGVRLWPLSRASFPKQYLNFEEKDKNTLLQNTFLRLSGIKNLLHPLIICNEEQRFIVAEQMRSIKVEPLSILLEPFGKNTAPAITLGSLIGIREKNDPILLILSSDHKIENNMNFINAFEEGLVHAKNGRIVTFGIIPTSPEIGYGYIESFEKISKENKFSKIKRFIEKPNQKKANKLYKDLHFSWNSGIFIARASVILKEIKKYQPKIVEICRNSLKSSCKDFNFERIDQEIFKDCPNISIDFAVMENTNLGTVVALDAGWDDLRSWKSIWENSKVNEENNTLIGKIFTKNVKNSYLRSESRLVVALGMRNIILIETEDAILVAEKKDINDLKEFIKDLENKNVQEVKNNKIFHRPWGQYTSLIENETWQVKRIKVYPNESLSLQLHNYRSEHWIVVDGIAKVDVEDKSFLLNKNESTYIPLGSKHRLSNPGNKPLILIEVQSGTYLGEDDIVRFQDKYRRKTN